MEELKRHFITSDREYREGEVFVYEQKFTVKDVKKAVFTATALGVYEAEINGVKIGKQMFAPGYSYYPRRVLYQTYEVSALLREGANTLRVYLGQGWYCGRFLCENKTQIYGEKPAVSWILKIEDAAGVRDIVSGEQTDELESPYGYAGEYDGEIYFADGRSAVIGHPVSIKNELDFALEPTLTEVALQEEMEVKEAKQTGNVTILDFGQNFAGIVEIDPSFLTNETITIRHGEILNADGSLYTANLRKAKATIVYHAGAEKKKYRPRFTYMGFRYMELSGVDYQSGMIKAYAIHTDMKRTGYFRVRIQWFRSYMRIRSGGRNPTMWKCRPTVRSGMNVWVIPGMVRCLHAPEPTILTPMISGKTFCVIWNWDSLTTRKGMCVPLCRRPDLPELVLSAC